VLLRSHCDSLKHACVTQIESELVKNHMAYVIPVAVDSVVKQLTL